MNKGMIYTSFAILSSSLLLLVAAFPVTNSMQVDEGEAIRISEASFFLESVLSDMDRSLEISTRRALAGAAGYVVSTGERIGNPEENVTSALVNGTISGKELNATKNATLTDWSFRVADVAKRSNYGLEIQLRNQSFNSSGFHVNSSYRVFTRLEDPSTLASFNRSNSASSRVSVTGLEDTMTLLRSEGRYVSIIEKCEFGGPAQQLYTGTVSSNGTIQGYAVVEPDPLALSSVENKSEKILVTEDITVYDPTEVNEFAGSVSAIVGSETLFSNEYVFGTGSVNDVEPGMSLILHKKQVWKSSLREMFQEGCYVKDDTGPDFFDRLGNRLVSPDSEGIATLLEVPRLPSELQKQDSAVAHVYFNGTGYGSLKKVKGVNYEYQWFRLDQKHVDEWGLEPLAYE